MKLLYDKFFYEASISVTFCIPVSEIDRWRGEARCVLAGTILDTFSSVFKLVIFFHLHLISSNKIIFIRNVYFQIKSKILYNFAIFCSLQPYAQKDLNV